MFSRKNSRTSRFIRFLRTAFPVRLLAVIPSLLVPVPLRPTITKKCSVWTFLPERFRLTKSFRFSILRVFGNEKEPIRNETLFNGNFAVWRTLHGQPFAPFGASSSNHPGSAVGPHSGPETVCAGSLDLAGLIRSFHGSLIPICAKVVGSDCLRTNFYLNHNFRPCQEEK